jgi:hypothetical protein
VNLSFDLLFYFSTLPHNNNNTTTTTIGVRSIGKTVAPLSYSSSDSCCLRLQVRVEKGKKVLKKIRSKARSSSSKNPHIRKVQGAPKPVTDQAADEAI